MQIGEIFKYTDYRSFLHAYAHDAKRKNSRWSYGQWAMQLDLRGTASLTMVLNGQRKPGPEITHKLISFFKFKGKEREYFYDLVRLEKVKDDPRLSVLLMEQMSKVHPNQEFRVLDYKTFSAISHWHYYAIREMTRLSDFKENPDWISKKLYFKITPRDVKVAVQTLLELELLKRGDNGKLEVSHGRLDTKNDVADEGIKRFHEQMISHAKEAVRLIPVGEREITASTFTLKVSNIPRAKEMIRKFKQRFCCLLEEEGGNQTYQINIQFFPLTKGGKES